MNLGITCFEFFTRLFKETIDVDINTIGIRGSGLQGSGIIDHPRRRPGIGFVQAARRSPFVVVHSNERKDRRIVIESLECRTGVRRSLLYSWKWSGKNRKHIGNTIRLLSRPGMNCDRVGIATRSRRMRKSDSRCVWSAAGAVDWVCCSRMRSRELEVGITLTNRREGSLVDLGDNM